MSRVLLGDGELSTFPFKGGVYVRMSNTRGRPDADMGAKLTIHEAIETTENLLKEREQSNDH